MARALATNSRGGMLLEVNLIHIERFFWENLMKMICFLNQDSAFLIIKHHKHYKIVKSQKKQLKK